MLYVGLSQRQATVWMFTVMIMNVANRNDSLMYFHWAGQWRVSFPWLFSFFHQHSLKQTVESMNSSDLCATAYLAFSFSFSFLPMPLMLAGSPCLEGDRNREAVRLSLRSGRSLYLSRTFWKVEATERSKGWTFLPHREFTAWQETRCCCCKTLPDSIFFSFGHLKSIRDVFCLSLCLRNENILSSCREQ